MNHIYRSIWNENTGTFVAVSENTRSGGKSASRGNDVTGAGFALKVLAVSMMMAYGANVHALPVNGVVTAGSATITSGAGNMTVNQGSQNAVLNWQSFNIGQSETVRFVQPNSSSVALNRVLGSDPSSILGNLSANGKVFLVNPNGILFGKGASVNVGGLVASTRDISDSDFMAGNYRFAGAGDSSVTNQGTINADGGYVALLGANVSNEGTINARLGTVALAAGNAITLDVVGDGLLNVTVDQGAVKALVNNGGMIQADGGQVLLTAQAAGNLLQTAVNNTGIIQAQTIENHNGTIRLLGDMQSGTVNAGGTLDASAPKGGDGGFIETSAAHVKTAGTLKVTTAAAHGLTGSWLIDPVDYTIAASGGDTTGAALSADLGSTDITIASTSGTSGANGDVNVNDTVTWSANKLTLNAQNNININANMNASATASLALDFGQGAVAAGNTSNIITTGASVNLPASTTNFTTKQGSDGSVKNYTVITSLGAAGSTTTTDLQGMNGNLTLNYVLGADIDASATSGWNSGAGFVPVGGTGCWPCTHFTGTFDGLGHTVSGLTINRPSTSMIGLFGYGATTSVIRNVGLVGGSMSGASYTGTLIGRNGGTVFNSYATLNVTGTGYVGGLIGRNYGKVSNSYATGNATGSHVGGLIGINESGTVISNSHATGSVTGSQYAGGLIGQSDTATISNSYATGNVTNTSDRAGGLVGEMKSGGSISNSYATGSVSGAGYVGGLVGEMNSGGSISNSYATGSVSGADFTGGLVGETIGTTIGNSHATGNVTGTGRFTGGLVGLTYGGTLSNSYATGSVSSTDGDGYTGGLVGYGYGGTYNDNYATGAASGTSDVGGLMGGVIDATVARNYSVGAVSGSSGLGGLIGYNGGGSSVTNSYWNTDTSGQASSVSGTGLTTVQMQTASNFSGFNFTTTPGATGNNWVMVDVDSSLNNAGGAVGGTLPMQASEYATTINNAHQLQLMQMDPTANYTLGQNINAAATGTTGDVWAGSTFIPIGSAGTQFTGTFNGLSHTISGLTINLASTSYLGLFGTTASGSSISNVGLVGGSVTSIGGAYVGSLVGSNGGAISNSFATTNATADAYAGGLVGYMISTGTIDNSYAGGAVAGIRAAGLVGRNAGTVTNSYSTGAATGGTNGGLIGLSSAGTVTNSFWDETTSGQSTSQGGTGMTTADMQTQANFTSATTANGNANPNWDFTNTWFQFDGTSYSLLRSFMTPLTVTANSASKTYDGAAYSGGNGFSYSIVPDGSFLTGAVTYGGTAQGSVNVGSYTIALGGLTSTQEGYLINYVDGALTVNKANLTLSTSDVTKTYDGGLTAAGTATVTSGTLYGSDSLSGGTFAFTDKNAGAGNKTVTTSGVTVSDGNSGGNYNVTYADNTTSTIVAKALTVSGQSASNKVYDGSAIATLAGGTLAGVISGDSVTLTEAGSFVTPDVGSAIAVTAADSISGADAGNYSMTQPLGLSADITAAINPTNPIVNTDPRMDDAIAYAILTTSTSTSPAQGNLPDSHLSANQNAGYAMDIGYTPGGLTGLNLSVTGNGILLPPGVTGRDSDKDNDEK